MTIMPELDQMIAWHPKKWQANIWTKDIYAVYVSFSLV